MKKMVLAYCLSKETASVIMTLYKDPKVLVCKEWIKTWLGGGGNPPGIVQEVWIQPYEQTVHAQSRIRPRKWDAQNYLGFWDTNVSPNFGQTIVS